ALVVQDSRITDNHVNTSGWDGGGGGIWNERGTLTIANSTIANNTAPGLGVSPGYTRGGGIYTFGGTATITGSTLTGNSASAGGGIYGGGTIAITDCTISGNLSQAGPGGGIYLFGTGTGLTLANSTVASNQAANGGWGGGIFLSQRTTATIT